LAYEGRDRDGGLLRSSQFEVFAFFSGHRRRGRRVPTPDARLQLLTSPYGKLLSTLLGGIQIDGQLAEAFRSTWLEPRHTEAKEALIDALYGPVKTFVSPGAK
jgi:hypothetical protein